MKRAALWIAGIAVALVAGAWLATLSPAVDVWLYRRAAERLAGKPDAMLAKPGDLSVLMCGTGSPLPDLHRASACTLVAAGGHLYVVDIGLSSVRNLMLWRVPLKQIDGVLLTHFHSDHIAELGELQLQTWVAGRRGPLTVYGPPGVGDVVEGFNRAYSHDSDYRTLHHGQAFLPREAADMIAVPVAMTGATATVLNKEGLKIAAIRVHHDPVKPAYGYRFDYGGRSVVISGDTAPFEPLVQTARGADVLVHEAQSNALVGILGRALAGTGRNRSAKIMHDIPSYHTDPVAAVRLANAAHVKLLVFSHINPPLPDAIAERAFLRGVSDVRARGWVLAHDGLLIRLPGHSAEIEQTSIE